MQGATFLFLQLIAHLCFQRRWEKQGKFVSLPEKIKDSVTFVDSQNNLVKESSLSTRSDDHEFVVSRRDVVSTIDSEVVASRTTNDETS